MPITSIPAQSIRSNIATILLALKAQVVAWPVTTGAICRITAPNPPMDLQADQYVALWCGGGPVEVENTYGSGRLDCRIIRKVIASIRTRLDVDEPYSDEAALTDAVLGHFIAEDALMDCLENFWPVNGSGIGLTYRPIRLKSLNDPIRPREPQPQGMSVGWTETQLVFDVPYVVDLNQTKNR